MIAGSLSSVVGRGVSSAQQPWSPRSFKEAKQVHRCPPRVSNRAERNGDGPERELGPELMRAEPDAEPDPNFMLAGQIVRELLARTSAYADDGAALSEDEKTRVDILLDMLAKWGIKQRPLEDPALFGNYRVVYTSSRGSPAGGVLLRGRRTRALFETRGLFQSVIPGVAGESVVVTNKVSAALFGLPFAVGLRGRVRPPSEEALEALQGTVADTVRVEFDPARLMLGNIELRVGTSSAVTLQTTYLDSKLRLGRGKLGSLFVFRRGQDADQQRMEHVGARRIGLAPQLAAIAATAMVAALGVACVAGMFGIGPLAGFPRDTELRGSARLALGILASLVRIAGAVLGALAIGLFRALIQALWVRDRATLAS